MPLSCPAVRVFGALLTLPVDQVTASLARTTKLIPVLELFGGSVAARPRDERAKSKHLNALFLESFALPSVSAVMPAPDPSGRGVFAEQPAFGWMTLVRFVGL